MTDSAREIRKEILRISACGRDGNLQSCFSSVDIIDYLFKKCNVGMQRINESCNLFVLSKGQSNLALLTTLGYYGFLNSDELYSFCRFDAKYSMQSDRTKVPEIIFSAGSLGHGICQAVGLAYGLKLNNKKQTVFCLVGDGELNEGTVWEALLFAASENLNNFVLLIDDNDSISEMINIKDLNTKIQAFNFDVFECNGNDFSCIDQCFNQLTYNRPSAIVAKTKRGFGSYTLENNRAWFHKFPSSEELSVLLKEIDQYA